MEPTDRKDFPSPPPLKRVNSPKTSESTLTPEETGSWRGGEVVKDQPPEPSKISKEVSQALCETSPLCKRKSSTSRESSPVSFPDNIAEHAATLQDIFAHSKPLPARTPWNHPGRAADFEKKLQRHFMN